MSSINILTLIVHRILSVILLCLKFLFILTLIHYHSVEYLNLANQKKEREGETYKMQTSLLTMILVVFFQSNSNVDIYNKILRSQYAKDTAGFKKEKKTLLFGCLLYCKRKYEKYTNM